MLFKKLLIIEIDLNNLIAKECVKLFMKNLITFLFLALFVISCSTNNEKNNNTRTVFKYNEMGAITSLDPAAARNTENIWAVNQLFNGLVEMDDSLKVQPSIAKSWAISTDGLTYTFNLKTNVVFHDNEFFPENKGRKVVANDFVYSFNRLLDSKVSSAISLLNYVNTEHQQGFEAPNDSTFIIHLNKSFSPFIGILTMKYFSVVPKECVEHYGEDFGRHPVGTGPFQFKRWDDGNKLIFVKNQNYFEYEGEKQLPYLDAVSISFIKDRETSFLEFMKGNVDMVSGIDAINTDEVLTEDGLLKDKFKNEFYLQATPFLKTDYLGFLIDENMASVKNSPFKIKALRQAIGYGFDRVKMVKYLRKNLGTPATAGFIPPGLPSFDKTKVKGYDYNPEKAKELLFLAGFADGKGLPEITLASTEQYLELAEYIQSQLGELGIKIKIDIQKPSVLIESIANAKVPFFRKSWVGDYADEENFLSLFYSKNFSPQAFNYTHYSNPQFDILFEKSQLELNDSIRKEEYQQMDRILMEDAPIVPLYYDEVVRLVQNNIQNFNPNCMNLLSLKRTKKVNQ